MYFGRQLHLRSRSLLHKSKHPEFAMRSHVVLTVLKACEMSRRDNRDGAWWLAHPWEQPALTLHCLPLPSEEGYCQALEACKLPELKQVKGVGDDGEVEGEVTGKRKVDEGARDGILKEGLDREGIPLKEYVKRLPNYKEVIKKLVKFALFGVQRRGVVCGLCCVVECFHFSLFT